ncbi:MAG: hypothetical protein WEC84_01505 [Candidatus Andersenbacteria bacterium]
MKVIKARFLVPRTLTWDKLAALFLAVWQLTGRMPWKFSALLREGFVELFFEGDRDVPDDVVDIDVRRKYHGRGASASHIVAEGLDVPGLNRALSLIGLNNKTGCLKEDEHSFVALIRECYKVGSENPSRDKRIAVISLFLPVLAVYFQAATHNEAAVKELHNPFTLPSLRKLLELCPDINEQFKQNLLAELESQFEVQERASDRTAELVANLKPDKTFTVQGQGGQPLQGHVIRSDNTRIPAEYFRRKDTTGMVVLVMVRWSGHMAIFCRGQQDFSPLHQALVAADASNRWFLDTRPQSPQLLNGSTSRSAEPTTLTVCQVVELIQQHHKHQGQKQRRGDGKGYRGKREGK